MNEYATILETSVFGRILIVVLGLIFGSFFNACIARLPDNVTLMTRSQCPRCHTLIPWYFNIPVVSYLWLRGVCHSCRKRISVQYPLVEIGTAGVYLGLLLHFGIGWRFFAYATFLSLLLVISVIDLYHQIIPDELSLPGIALGFIFCFLTNDISWWQSLLGIGLGGGIFLFVAYLYERFAKREGLGGGDIKLLGMIGAWLGYQCLLPVIILSSAAGSVVGIFVMFSQKKDFKTAIPFGPFLAAAAVVYLFLSGPINFLLFPELP